MGKCYLCPRRCGVRRPLRRSDGTGTYGFCHCARTPVVARAALHYGEEPCISGTRGSGAVFFSGCTLRCLYCQNSDISFSGKGKEISIARLKEIYGELIVKGAHNINLVTPSQFSEAIIASLEPAPAVPVICNCSGYETVDALQHWQGHVQIYLPDLKYSDNQLAAKYSGAGDYFQIATTAIKEMYRQLGPYQLDQNGLLRSGVIIRHLILPGQANNTKDVIDWVAQNFTEGQILFSLMRQYIPCGKAAQYPELNRIVSDEEYDQLEQYLFNSGIEDGFVQEKEAASDSFIPAFDGTGV